MSDDDLQMLVDWQAAYVVAVEDARQLRRRLERAIHEVCGRRGRGSYSEVARALGWSRQAVRQAAARGASR